MDKDELFGLYDRELEMDELAYRRISDMIIIHPTLPHSRIVNVPKVNVPVHIHIERPCANPSTIMEQLMKESDATEDFKISNYRDELGPDPVQGETGIRHGKRAFNDNRLALVAIAKAKRVSKSRKANKLAAKQRKANRK